MGELLLQHELMGVVRVWHGRLYYNVLFVTKCGCEWEERPVLISCFFVHTEAGVSGIHAILLKVIELLYMADAIDCVYLHVPDACEPINVWLFLDSDSGSLSA